MPQQEGSPWLAFIQEPLRGGFPGIVFPKVSFHGKELGENGSTAKRDRTVLDNSGTGGSLGEQKSLREWGSSLPSDLW